MTLNIPSYFKRYAWSVEKLEENFWRSTFANDREEDFDLYVMLDEEWVNFAVSPLVAKPAPDCQARLYATLLHLNQQMRLAAFAVDDDGDVNLLASLPRHGFAYRHFAITLDALAYYTDRLAPDLARLANEPTFFASPG